MRCLILILLISCSPWKKESKVISECDNRRQVIMTYSIDGLRYRIDTVKCKKYEQKYNNQSKESL